MKVRLLTILSTVVIILAISLTIAQTSCPAIIDNALNAIGDNCGDIGRNMVCYGHEQVSAEFFGDVPADYFTTPSQSVPLDNLAVLRTAPLDSVTSQWGIAVMNLQANIPNSIPGQSVKVLLMGDVEVENAVEPEQVYTPIEPIAVVVTQGANIRSGPGLNFNVVGSVQGGFEVLVDGQSDDGMWLRTSVNDRVGWIFRELVNMTANLGELPVFDETLRTPMQSIFLRTGIGDPACDEAPQDSLLVQGPRGFEIDFTVNGTNIKIASTVRIRILDEGDTMEIEVIDGRVTIPNGGANGQDIIINSNSRSTVCLGDPENRGVDGSANDRIPDCAWTSPQFTPPSARQPQDCTLEAVPEITINYTINICSVPVPSETPAPVGSPTTDTLNACSSGGVWDDGRCVDDWWWQAGYFYGRVEAGVIATNEIPPFYTIPTGIPTKTTFPTREPTNPTP